MTPPGRRLFLQRAALGVAGAAGAVALGLRARPSGPATSTASSVGSSIAGASAATPGAGDGDRLVAAAQREATLAVVTWGDRAYHGVFAAFEAAFPGVRVAQIAESNPSTWLDLARQRRRAGNALDIALVQPERAIQDGRAEGMWTPLRPLLVRPDILDDATWRGGFGARFLDRGETLCFDWEHSVVHAYAVNTDLVPPEAIKSVVDLLDRRWQGQVISFDPRVGLAASSAAAVAARHGRDVLKRLLVDQRPARSPNAEHITESLISGRFAVALGVRPKALEAFRGRGAERVRFLDLPDADFVPSTGLLAFAEAKHPAAAQLFANWFLTREAQAIIAKDMPTNSARMDVAASDATAAGTAPYYDADREANYQHLADTAQFVRSIVS